MKPSPVPPLSDPLLLKAGDALIRAARSARELALRTGTPCYIWEDGRVVNVGAPTRVPAALPTLDNSPPEGII